MKKGQPLFQFDRRPYEYQVRLLEAQLDAASASEVATKYKVDQLKAGLAGANQDVLMYKADLEGAKQKVVRTKSNLEYTKYQQQMSEGLAQQGAGPEEDAQKWKAQAAANEAAVKEATRQGRAIAAEVAVAIRRSEHDGGRSSRPVEGG